MTKRALMAIVITIVICGNAGAQFVEPDVSVIELFQGDEVGDRFGWVCAEIDDLDGDGAKELLIPAITFGAFAGRVTVYSGATGIVLNDIVGADGEIIGYSASGVGDVNGDGTPDYAFGGGRVQVISGADHSVLYDFTDEVGGFASAIGRAGDVNGDGRDDVLVGNENESSVASFAGRTYLFSGADGSELWQVDGPAENAAFGTGVGGLGSDVDGDGTLEVISAAYGVGEAYILSGTDGSIVRTLLPPVPEQAAFFGQFFASGAGDVNRDGIGDVYVGDYGADGGRGSATVYSGRTGRILRNFPGRDADDGFGPGRVIDDANGDGIRDVLVAAYTDADGAAAAGATYLYSGRSGALLRTITSTVPGDLFGVDAISTGDVDFDGLPDFLVTAVGPAFFGTGPGAAFLIGGTVLPCPSDLDGNGFVGFFDLIDLVAKVKAGDPAGDLDGDRETDSDDLRVLLRDFGRCPAGAPGSSDDDDDDD